MFDSVKKCLLVNQGKNNLENFQFLTTFENLAKRDMTMEEWNNFKNLTNTKSNYFIENIILKED